MQWKVNIEMIVQQIQHAFSPHERLLRSGAVPAPQPQLDDCIFSSGQNGGSTDTYDNYFWRVQMKKKTLLGMLIGIASVICLAPTAKATTYNVGTAAELRAITTTSSRNYSGDTINLTADIDLGGTAFTPIGSEAYPFAGTFEGNNHTISGLYINNSSANYQGLFGKTSSTSTIQNVSVAGSVTGNRYTGMLIGYGLGSVKNCSTDGNVTSTVQSTGALGGVVGANYGIIEDCKSQCSVSGRSNFGGIAGENSGTIKNSSNKGEIVYSVASGVHGTIRAGGIAGLNYAGGIITNCYNDKIIRKTNVASAYSHYDFGGIVGRNIGTITRCYNNANISLLGCSYIGGIAGENYSEGTITFCYNIGNIIGTQTVGGIVGTLSGTVDNVYNMGNIRYTQAMNTADDPSLSGGGIAGFISTDDRNLKTCI